MRSDGETKKPVLYRGPDAAEHFLKALQKEADAVIKFLSNPKPVKLTSEDRKKYKEASMCHVCDEPLYVNKVLDYDI